MKKFLVFLCLLIASLAYAAPANNTGTFTTANCSTIPNPVTNATWCFNTGTGHLYVYNGSGYTDLSAGNGTVTSVSTSNAAPLFTTAVTNSTTTPAITYSPSSSTANTVYGNATGSPGVPAFGQVVAGQIANSAVTTTKIADGNVTLGKIANAAASNKLVGSGASGSGTPYTELTLGTNLSMSGTTLNASGGGTGCNTSGNSVLAGDNSGGCTNVTIGTGLSFSANTLSATGGGSTTHALAFTLGDPNGSALTTSNVTYFTVPFACTIQAYNLAIDAADATFKVKFWKVATGTAIPTSSNSISTSGVGVPTGTALHSTSLGDFTTTTVNQNDIMAMSVWVANTAKFVNGVLQCQ